MQFCQFVRVVKEVDSKSTGFTRTGSNPVADENFFFLLIVFRYLLLISH